MPGDYITHCCRCNKSVRTDLPVHGISVLLICPECANLCDTDDDIKWMLAYAAFKEEERQHARLLGIEA